MKLSEVLTKELINTDLRSQDKEELFEEMVELLYRAGKIQDRQDALDAISEREEKMSTGIGNGIAIPHGKSKKVRELLMTLGLSKQGIEYEALDNKPVKVVILVLANAANPGPHIEALAQISRLLDEPGFVEKLVAAKTPEEALKIIKTEED